MPDDNEFEPPFAVTLAPPTQEELPAAERETLPPSATEEEAAKKNSTIIPPGTDIERAIFVIAKASREMRSVREEIATGFKAQGTQLGTIQREVRRINQRVTYLETDQSELRAEFLVVKRRLRRALRRIAALEAKAAP